MRRILHFTFILIFLPSLSWGGLAVAETALERSQVSIDRVASRLNIPWSLTFLNDCEFLVTERDGSLLHYDAKGSRTPVRHDLKILRGGQGGLLDVVAASDFRQSRQVYLSYATGLKRGLHGLAISSAVLAADNRTLNNSRVIFATEPGQSSSRHYGSRVVETPDGRLFVTIGDRGNRDAAQDLSMYNGKIVRINKDGTVPMDNPFRGQSGARPEIWSYGHRNPQGAGLDLAGNLLISEHGARGGDEVNRVRKGRNYGWPIIAYGTHYSGARIGVGTVRDGMEQPEYYWDPSMAPSGLMVYSGKLWPEWTGNVFVGSLKFDYISRLNLIGGMTEIEQIILPETKRVRDVREAPDGTIWFLSEDRKSLYRMRPIDFDPVCAY